MRADGGSGANAQTSALNISGGAPPMPTGKLQHGTIPFKALQ